MEKNNSPLNTSDVALHPEKSLGQVGVIGRFRPLHNGGALMLEAICNNATQVKIGIGSSNKYNLRNPFTPQETKDMIHAYLTPHNSNYTLIEIPDFAHLPEYKDGKQWKEYLVETFGPLNHFITGNPYVKELLQDTYDIIHPATLIPKEKKLWLKGSIVRMEMARHGSWQDLVPPEVAQYLATNHLDERFRREFGLATLSQLADSVDYTQRETTAQEYQHTTEV